jgi:hypothetical protein
MSPDCGRKLIIPKSQVQIPERAVEWVMETGKVPLHLSIYLVVYIDLLGQSAELEKVRDMPETDVEIEAASVAIDQSAGRVLRLRNRFQGVVSELMSAHSQLVELIAPEHRESFMRLQPQVNQIGFSDTFVVSVPLQERGEPEGPARAASAVYNVLVGVAGISLVALSEGVPLRGGLQVGPAVDIFPQEVYGAPLVDAYRLESQVAEYPRTAVSPDFFGYLEYLARLPSDCRFNDYAATKAGQCYRLICQAPDDGRPMLHMLSPEVTKAAPEFEPYRAPAHKWVTSQLDRYRRERNQKLADRYARLARYFETYA